MRMGHRKTYAPNEDGVVTGGSSTGIGFHIAWQDGPLDRNKKGEPRPNGAFIEDVIEAAHDRLVAMQESKFACVENEMAIGHLAGALAALDARAKRRDGEGVHGSHDLPQSDGGDS